MSDLTIKLDNSQVRTAVEDAILRTLDAETQQVLIREALAYLTKPYDRQYGNGPKTSPITEAFQHTITGVVHTTASALLAEGTELRASLDAMINDLLREWITKKDEAFCRALGTGIAEALKGRTDDY